MSTGSGSSFAITRLAAAYNRQQKDGNVLSSQNVIKLIDFRLEQLLGRVDVDEAPGRVKKLYEIWQSFKVATPGTTSYILGMKNLDDAFEKIYQDHASWTQIFEAIDLRGKMTEREIKALTQIKAVMTAEDGYHMIAKVMAVTMRIIGDDPKKLKELQYEYARLIGESSDLVAQGVIEDDGGSSQAE